MFRKINAGSGRDVAPTTQHTVANELYTMVVERAAYVAPRNFNKTIILAIITNYLKTPSSMSKTIGEKYDDIVALLVKAGIFTR